MINTRLIKVNIFFLFVRLFNLNFYAKQNYPPLNDGYESFSIRKLSKYYFYGTYKEYSEFHKRLIPERRK